MKIMKLDKNKLYHITSVKTIFTVLREASALSHNHGESVINLDERLIRTKWHVTNYAGCSRSIQPARDTIFNNSNVTWIESD